LPVKKVLPGVLVVAGPVKELKTSTGLLGAAASSSARVGRRFSANCAGVQPPIAVINAPAFTVLVRARIAACTSAIDAAVSSRVSWPGRRPSSRK
jgi:hypothetical protein